MSDQHWAMSPHVHCTPREEGVSVPSHAGVIHAENTAANGSWLVGGTPDTEAALPCRQHPADLWFAELPEEVEAAKALCAGCPIRSQCLEQALERNEPWGVWGGQLVLQGVVVPRKRPRGRPRKNPVAA
jgi:WhiB family redox-sensing transcriptional regulator